jgi:ribosomal peptide maturation radical SAM protein 1
MSNTNDAVIVVPPFASVAYPALAPHALQASARESGLNVKVLYANILFARAAGWGLYESLQENDFGLGEWIFADAAFEIPPAKPRTEKMSDPAWLARQINSDCTLRNARVILDILSPLKKKTSLTPMDGKQPHTEIDWKQLQNEAANWVETTAQSVVDAGYRVVGCTTTFGAMTPSLALLRRVKEIDPSVITILGGSLCEAEMADGVISTGVPVDYVFSGEGEIGFPLFLRQVLDGKRPTERILRGECVANLDSLPLPDFSEFIAQVKDHPELSAIVEKRHIPYESSRGCGWNACTFCGLSGAQKRSRRKSPERVIADLRVLRKEYNPECILMTDLMMPPAYHSQLVPRLARESAGMTIFYEQRAEITLRQMIAFKQAGISAIQPGIESLSPSLLKRMNKGITSSACVSMLRFARSVGVRANWNMMFGFPNDEGSDYEEMLPIVPLLSHLEAPVSLVSMRLFRFSAYHRYPQRFGVRNLRPRQVDLQIFPEYTEMSKIGYVLAGDYPSGILDNSSLAMHFAQAITNWQDHWRLYVDYGLEFTLPSLHVSRLSSTEYLLTDRRGLPQGDQEFTLTRDQAKAVLLPFPLGLRDECRWAIDRKFCVVLDGISCPLATADPELILELEQDCEPYEPEARNQRLDFSVLHSDRLSWPSSSCQNGDVQ